MKQENSLFLPIKDWSACLSNSEFQDKMNSKPDQSLPTRTGSGFKRPNTFSRRPSPWRSIARPQDRYPGRYPKRIPPADLLGSIARRPIADWDYCICQLRKPRIIVAVWPAEGDTQELLRESKIGACISR
ncbi:hypothetical protein BDW68DRAFT_163432 [Aspergillus falconensis]